MMFAWITTHMARAGLSVFGQFLDVFITIIVWMTPVFGLKPIKLFDFIDHPLMMMSTLSPALAH